VFFETFIRNIKLTNLKDPSQKGAPDELSNFSTFSSRKKESPRQHERSQRAADRSPPKKLAASGFQENGQCAADRFPNPAKENGSRRQQVWAWTERVRNTPE
jgi:hypothetical protein